jgi:hypothetical protein
LAYTLIRECGYKYFSARGHRKIYKSGNLRKMAKMGVFDKLTFWKKKEDDFGLSELDKSLKIPTGLPASPDANLGFGQQPFSQQQTGLPPSQYDYNQPQQMQSFQQDQSYALQKEIEVISIKLDAIKAAIETISQRLASLERFAYASNEPQQQAPIPRQYYREYPPRSY